MQVEIKKLEKSEVEIIGEVSADVFEGNRKRAIEELGKNIKIDGFRPGHVPEDVLIKKVGEHVILERMAEFALQKEYPKILEENKIDAIGRPEIAITKIAKNNPLGFKIKTAIMPEIELPDYKNLAQEAGKDKGLIKEKEALEKGEIDEGEIDEVVEQLRKMRATKDDKGEMILPEVNDDFVKELGGPGGESVETFKKTIRENLLEEKKVKLKEKKRISIIEKIIDKSKIDVPQILIDSELNKMTEEMKANISRSGLKWEDYLKHLKKEEEELKKEWEKDALKRAKFGLIINKIAELEKVEVPEGELQKETDKIIEYYKNTGSGGTSIDPEQAKAYTYGILRNEAVFKILEEF